MNKIVNFPGTTSDGGSPPTGVPPGLEARVANVEATVVYIKEDIKDIKHDIREIRNWILGGFIFLLTAFAAGYIKLSDKIDATSVKTESTLNKILDRLPESHPARKP